MCYFTFVSYPMDINFMLNIRVLVPDELILGEWEGFSVGPCNFCTGGGGGGALSMLKYTGILGTKWPTLSVTSLRERDILPKTI